MNTGGPLTGGYGTELQYTGDFGPFEVPQNIYEVTDSVSLTLKSHQISAGGTLIRRVTNYYRPIEGKGGLFYSPQLFTGYDESEYLVGGVSQYQIGTQIGFFSNINQEDGLFVQDNWRVSPRLTLNLGLRYDLLTWPYEAHNQQSSFNVNNGQVLLAGQNGVSRTIVSQDYLNFAPRVGLAYDLSRDGRTALHGGYGIFYFPDYGGINNQLGQNGPFSGNNYFQAQDGYCITLSGQTSRRQAPYSCADYTSPAAVTAPLPIPPSVSTFNAANPPSGLGGTAINVNNEHSRLQQYNLQLQQQLGSKDVFSMAYVGTKATGCPPSTISPRTISARRRGLTRTRQAGLPTTGITAVQLQRPAAPLRASQRELAGHRLVCLVARTGQHQQPLWWNARSSPAVLRSSRQLWQFQPR